MINSLSILLPTYNCRCTKLVGLLQRQCMSITEKHDNFKFEIIVADDASTDTALVEENKAICQLEHVRYIIMPKNVGRAKIRNILASEATCEWVLFMDGDLNLDNPQFIEKYLLTDKELMVGGITIGGDEKQWGNNLRWRYEKHCEQQHSALMRQRNGETALRTTNFCIMRKLILSHPFDENFTHYGYEDVLLGKALAADGVTFTHIDNTVLLDDYESNDEYICKTEEAMRTLAEFRDILRGHSTLLATVEKIHNSKLSTLSCMLLEMVWKTSNNTIKHQLKSNKPSVLLFNIYRLLYLSHLINQ